jgi:peroxiredoxin
MGILQRLSRWVGSSEKMNTIVAGQTAPDFSLKSIDGTEYSLQTLLARGPVFVSFFKVSCPVCQFTFPFLERLHKRYGGKDVAFVGISQDNARATKEFARKCHSQRFSVQMNPSPPIALVEDPKTRFGRT